MTILLYLLIALLLLLLNAFFVLAEFASVKARPTQMDALASRGNKGAKKVQYIQTHLDKFLSVCQIGITLASIGLGFVAEPAIAHLFAPLLKRLGIHSSVELAAHGIALSISYILVSYLHIVIGEQVPKMIAIRRTEKTALFIAYPMLFFHYLFIIPLWILNFSTNSILRILGISPYKGHEQHSEDEIRIILDQSQSSGMMSLRRLLYLENVLDFGGLTVRNAMKTRDKVRALTIGSTIADIDASIARYRYSRYPVVNLDQTPAGFIHVKDLYLAGRAGRPTDYLAPYIKPCLKAYEDAPLESILPIMQRRGIHMALVYNKNGMWTGIITIEDVLEEVVGTIEEEYPLEPSVMLTSALKSPGHIVLGIEGETIVTGARDALSRVGSGILPLPVSEIMPHIADRERTGSSYVGRRLAIPHARLKSLSFPVLVVARFKKPIPTPSASTAETINYLFILLTPENEPRLHQILLTHIAGIFESGFLLTRLEEAKTPQELYDAICTVDQATDMNL